MNVPPGRDRQATAQPPLADEESAPSADALARPRYRPDVVAVLRGLLADQPGIVEGPMFGLPAFFVAGKLFACAYGDGVGVKLPPERVAALLKLPEATPFRPYGKPAMRAWVQLSRASVEEYVGDLDLLLESARFVAERAASSAPRPRRTSTRSRPSAHPRSRPSRSPR